MISSFIFWFCGPSPILQLNVRQYAPPLNPLSCFFVRIMEKSFSTLEVVGEIFPEISAQLSSHVIKRWQRWIGSYNQQGRSKEGGGSEKVVWKVNSPSLNLQRHYTNSFTWSNVGDLIGVEFLRKISMFRNYVVAIVPTHSLSQMLVNAIGVGQKFCRLLLTSSLKREIENYSS